MPLTDAKCRTVKSTAKTFRLLDEKGLYLEVNPSGSKIWRFRFCLDKKESYYSICDYPTMSLKEAREKAIELRKLVNQKISPVQYRADLDYQRQEKNKNTFEIVFNHWLSLRDWKGVTKKRRAEMIEKWVLSISVQNFPVLG